MISERPREATNIVKMPARRRRIGRQKVSSRPMPRAAIATTAAIAASTMLAPQTMLTTTAANAP